MSSCRVILSGIFALSLWTPWIVQGAEPLDRARIETRQQALQKEREEIGERFINASRQCWQRFMVNDCLHAARLQRRQALAPIEKQEQALRAAQRAVMLSDRQLRLNAKQPESQTLHDD